MVKAYDALGLTDLRDDAERVMRKNFPNSEYYIRGLDRQEPWWKTLVDRPRPRENMDTGRPSLLEMGGTILPSHLRSTA
jgi:hypothetical protein